MKLQSQIRTRLRLFQIKCDLSLENLARTSGTNVSTITFITLVEKRFLQVASLEEF